MTAKHHLTIGPDGRVTGFVVFGNFNAYTFATAPDYAGKRERDHRDGAI